VNFGLVLRRPNWDRPDYRTNGFSETSHSAFCWTQVLRTVSRLQVSVDTQVEISIAQSLHGLAVWLKHPRAQEGGWGTLLNGVARGDRWLGRLFGIWVWRWERQWLMASGPSAPLRVNPSRLRVNEWREKRFEERSRSLLPRSGSGWEAEGKAEIETGKEKRDFSLRRPTHSQERMRKKKVGLLRSKWRAGRGEDGKTRN